MLKYTPKDHADYKDLTKALAEVRIIADTVNEAKSQHEKREKVSIF